MDNKKPMPLLLIEDDVADCIKFKNCANNRTDITFVGMTGSSVEGLKYVQSAMPEGIILDLELNKGTGSGIQFLHDLKEAKLALRPIIIVTTNSPAEIVYNHVRDFGADFIFYKRKQDYSAEMVVNTMVALRKSWFEQQSSAFPGDLETLESPDDQRKRILERIDTELHLIGIAVNYKGHQYIRDCILALIIDKSNSQKVIDQVSQSYSTKYNAALRAMQTVIDRAWKYSSIDDLEKYYTAVVNINTGVPTPTDFIHYYADKIRKTI